MFYETIATQWVKMLIDEASAFGSSGIVPRSLVTASRI
jgi:hypothetical protein